MLDKYMPLLFSGYPVLTPFNKYSLFPVIWEATFWWPKMTLTSGIYIFSFPPQSVARVIGCHSCDYLTFHDKGDGLPHSWLNDATEDSISLHCWLWRRKLPWSKWPCLRSPHDKDCRWLLGAKRSPQQGTENFSSADTENEFCHQPKGDGKLVSPQPTLWETTAPVTT